MNSATKPDCHPLPRIDDCIDQIGSAQFISKFDLLKSYWQEPLSKHALEISAFVMPDGLPIYCDAIWYAERTCYIPAYT